MIEEELLFVYGSPAYVYQLRDLRDSYYALRSFLPQPSLLYYSLKANPHPVLIQELVKLGCKAEVSSIGELDAAISGGVKANECIYNGPGKTSSEIAYAIAHGVSHFSVDSPNDIRKVADRAERMANPVKLILRINPDGVSGGMGLMMTGTASQFGADASWILENPDLFSGTNWAEIAGFHVYTGSNISSSETLIEIFDIALKNTVDCAKALRIDPKFIDLGGGFGHLFAASGSRYDFTGLYEPLVALFERYYPGWNEGRPIIAFESGRYLVGSCGRLICTVEDVKYSKGIPFVILDSGINHLGGMSGLRRVPRIVPDLIRLQGDEEDKMLMNADVTGPLCTPLDLWAKGVNISMLKPGDVVAVPNVGAYGLTGSLLGFLSRPIPVEIILDDMELVHVSRLEITRKEDRFSNIR